MTKNSHAELKRLLQKRIEHPEKAAEIDQEIHQAFDRDCAIFVLDMSGFTRLTLRHGVIHFLTMIYRMTIIATPLVEAQGGKVVKQEADNLFATFPDVAAAVRAAIDIYKGFAAVNSGLPADHDLYASIGIGYGTTLVVDDNDLFGCEMNLACKLGEDLARRSEILLTEAAYEQVGSEFGEWEQLDLSTSSMELIAYKLK